MPASDFPRFETDLNRLAAKFDKEFKAVTAPGYPEARLRDDYLNPLLRALGWDLENAAALIQSQREVEIESRTDIEGRAKRADYLFRTDARARFVCEAKKPRSPLGRRDAFQAKRYAFNMGLPLAILSDFEEIKIYIVGGRPHIDRPDEGLWKTWHFQQFPLVAEEIWNLLAREKIAAGSIDALLDSLPKRAPAARGGKARQVYLIKPDRTRALDADFLTFLDEARHDLASSILQHNERAEVLADDRLNAATQHILDRLLFIRICEDRDIDTGTRLASIVDIWRRKFDRPGALPPKQASFLADPDSDADAPRPLPPESLWSAVVAHFRALDHRPPGNVPFFNGQLFKPHFSESLLVGDRWLAEFIARLSDDESPYLFNIIPVEILGSVYERFLGKVIRPHGRGVKTEEKPEVRKAGGVYYTPRYIVDYIVEQTVGKLAGEISAAAPKFAALEKQSRALRILDPACGSGSFLIRAFERMCEHWLAWLTAHPEDRKKKECWVDEKTGDVHLTVDLKRRILRDNVFGVDLDPQAVEVTQLSLYLKRLEGETRQTLAAERELFGEAIALLPSLETNIKCGNSLIASDFSLVAEDLIRVRAFDWPVQFRKIMNAGGFDAVIGNPPYRMLQPHNTEQEELDYFRSNYLAAVFKIELFHLFFQRGVSLLKQGGFHGYIIPTTLLNNVYAETLRRWLDNRCAILSISVAKGRVFEDADVHTTVLVLKRDGVAHGSNSVATTALLSQEFAVAPSGFSHIEQSKFAALPGATWNILLNDENVGLIERLVTTFSPLKAIGAINRGLITGDRGKFFSSTKDTESHVPILAGGDVRRYDTNPSSEFVLFERPDAAGGCWDADVHLAPHKLVIRQIGTRPTASVITEPIAVTGNIFTVRAKSLTEEKYLLAILNSKLTAYFWGIMFADFKASFPQVTIFSLSQVPISQPDLKPKADRALHDRLVALVDKMLTLTPKLRAEPNDTKRAVLENALAATDHQIDALVYQLYGLTPEEIALVETAPAP